MSPARQREHVDTCARTRQDTTKTAEWAAAHGVNLDDLDGHSQSLDVVEAPHDIDDSPVHFTSTEFSIDTGIEEQRAHYIASGDGVSLLVLDTHLAAHAPESRTNVRDALTGNARNCQRYLKSGATRLRANIKQTVGQLTDVPERAAEMIAYIRALPDDLQIEIAARVQRETDLRQIEQAIKASARKRKLSEGVLRVLDAIGRNAPQTRRRLAPLTKVEQVEALADLVAEWRKECRRIRAGDWEKQRRFEQAVDAQQRNAATETLKLWRSMPDVMKETTVAAITRDMDEGALL